MTAAEGLALLGRLTVWMMVGFIEAVPIEIEKAALIDGCSVPGVLVRIIVPLTAQGDDVKNFSQIWAVAPALVKLALRDVQQGQTDKEPPWKRIAKGPGLAT